MSRFLFTNGQTADRHVQTAIITHTITSEEVSAGYATIACSWDTPFSTDQYFVSIGCEVVSDVPLSDYGILSFSKTPTGVQCCIYVTTLGDVVAAHFVGMEL